MLPFSLAMILVGHTFAATQGWQHGPHTVAERLNQLKSPCAISFADFAMSSTGSRYRRRSPICHTEIQGRPYPADVPRMIERQAGTIIEVQSQRPALSPFFNNMDSFRVLLDLPAL